MSNVKLSVNIAGVELKNPVGTASGTFASGKEYAEFVDLNKLGSVTVKGVSDRPWNGNPTPRIAETYGGMLNSIGLQNNGVEAFIKDDLQFLKKYDTKIIVNVCGHTEEEYLNVIKALSGTEVDMLELNISCPNLSAGGLSFGTEATCAEKLVRSAKNCAKQPLIVKLSPNVTSIAEIAKAVESGGADAVSLINSVMGMRIDTVRKKPILGNKVGGLSGPAIKPVAVRMVYEVYKAVKIPIIGMGGIMDGNDAVEFMLAGARAVSVGMANFHNPRATEHVLEGVIGYAEKYGINDINELVGAAHL